MTNVQVVDKEIESTLPWNREMPYKKLTEKRLRLAVTPPKWLKQPRPFWVRVSLFSVFVVVFVSSSDHMNSRVTLPVMFSLYLSHAVDTSAWHMSLIQCSKLPVTKHTWSLPAGPRSAGTLPSRKIQSQFVTNLLSYLWRDKTPPFDADRRPCFEFLTSSFRYQSAPSILACHVSAWKNCRTAG